MKKALSISIALAFVGLATGLAAQTRYAEVVAVEPIQEMVKVPREDCREVPVSRPAEPRDQHQILGTVVGALAGGLLGNQVGGGKGKTVATIAGAVGGGYAGNRVQNHLQAGDTQTTTERQCSTVYDETQEVVGYNVEYKYDGQIRTARMDNHPGDRVQVDGNGVLLKQ